eukprot:7892063-Karenia_brevis.AAC.1
MSSAVPTIFSVVVLFTPRNMPAVHLASSLCFVLNLNSTHSPHGGSATLHGLPFSRWNGVKPSVPLPWNVMDAAAYSINHARAG